MAINYFSSGNESLSIANIDIIIFCQSADSPDYVINKQLIVRYQQPILSINIKWVVEKWRNSHSAIFLSLDKTELAFISLLDAYENENKKMNWWKKEIENVIITVTFEWEWLEENSRKQIHVDCTKSRFIVGACKNENIVIDKNSWKLCELG